jgi:Zn-dependent protease
MNVIVLILSLTVHEWAHAISAFKLGDDTAAREGRLTLNPVVHIDPFGTLLLPLLGIPFGWAKPVPVVPTRFRRDVPMGTGMALTAAAGPMSNVVLAFLCLLGMVAAFKFRPDLMIGKEAVYELLNKGVQVNVALAVFNALPIPPLDGSRIVDNYVPYRMRGSWDSFTRFAPLVLLAIIVLPFNVLGGPMLFVHDTLLRTVQWMVGLI